jgi:hypothetical protein
MYIPRREIMSYLTNNPYNSAYGRITSLIEVMTAFDSPIVQTGAPSIFDIR